MFLPLSLYAQQTGASLSGHTTDPSGAAIVGTKIQITSTTTGSVYTTESDSAGIYRIPFVTVGEYNLTAEKSGFKTYVQQGITLIIDQKATIDIQLQLGAVTQSVTVTANAPLLQAESADRGYTVDQARVATLPMGDLNTFEATYNAPGETVFGTSALEMELSEYATGAMSSALFNGGLGGNEFMVDGVLSSTGGVTPSNSWNPIDKGVQEVSTQTTMYDAQYGWSTGGVINTITKGGTNKWHGDAYENIDNTVLNAAAYGDNISGTPRDADPTYFDIYGITVGGPIIKNKLFGFVAWQNVSSVSPQPFETSVPTAAEAQGNFSGLYTDATKTQQVTIYDPLTTVLCPAAVAWCNAGNSGTYARQSFGAEYGTNNTIPIGRINPVATNVLKLIPPPNNANGYNDDGNFVQQPNYRKETDVNPQWTGRADLNLFGENPRLLPILSG